MQTKFQIWLQTANIETFRVEPELTRVVFLCADCPARSDCFESNDESLNCYDTQTSQMVQSLEITGVEGNKPP